MYGKSLFSSRTPSTKTFRRLWNWTFAKDLREISVLMSFLVSDCVAFFQRGEKVLKRFPLPKKYQNFTEETSNPMSSCFPRHFQSPWGSRWWGLWTCIHHVEVCFLTLHLFGIFGWISIIIIVVRSRHLTVAMVVGETTGLHLFLGDQVMSSGAIEFCERRSCVKNTDCVGSISEECEVKVWFKWAMPETVFVIENMHEISLKACAGMENYGDSWMFFFRFGRNFRAAETRKRISSRRPAHSAACCLKGQEVSRVTTQETSQIAPRLNFFANPHNFSRIFPGTPQ